MKGMIDIDTPALLLDEGKMNRNIKRMMKVKEDHVQVRPHFKTHKSIYIAKQQLMLGACGITVATTTEAELLLENGITDLLVAFPIADPNRIGRLLKWSKKARVIFTIDSVEQAMIMEQKAIEMDVKPEVWIKVNSGLNRCGVEPGKEAFELAKKIVKGQTLQFTGFYTHAGHSYAAKSAKEISKIAKQEAESILISAALCENEGISVPHRSVGSTPTFEIAAKFEGITEVRPGNAVFFDGMQVGLGVATFEEVAVTVLASIASKKKDRFIIDAGSKALTTEKGAHGNEKIKGYGRLVTNEELSVDRVSEEHGIVIQGDDNVVSNIAINDRIEIIPNHVCPVVNLYDHYYVKKENGNFEKWKVDGRGKSQ